MTPRRFAFIIVCLLIPSLNALHAQSPAPAPEDAPPEIATGTEAEPETEATPPRITWKTDHDSALAEAREARRPVMLYFSASWCQPCELLRTTTLRDTAVVNLLEPFTKIQIDYDSDPYLVASYGVTGVPGIILLDGTGERVATSLGYRDSERFQEWLARHAPDLSEEAAEAAEATRNALLVEIQTQLDTGDPAKRQAGLEQLFVACLEKNAAALAFAKDTLAALAREDASVLQPYLQDSRLLVRILCANALTSADPSFSFDPWKRN